MQEELKNKIKRTAKKVAAIGAGALVAGATMASAALAADLSGLPAPIVSSGTFDSYVVIGTSATTITSETLKDIAGAVELSTALGQLATTSTGAEGSATLTVRQFSGTNLDAIYVKTDTAGTTYHEDATWSALDSSTDLTALDDVPFTLSGGSVYNATISLTLDDDYVHLNRDALGITINSSTDADNVLTVTLDTNRTAGTDGHFFEGDSLNWFGTLYEIVDIGTDNNVTLGATSEVTANIGESFTIGGATFNFIDVDSSSSKAQITDASGTTYNINTTYTTIGTVQLRVKANSIFSGRTGASATFETVQNSYKFAVGDAWPLDTDFIVESVTVDTHPSLNSSIVLRNNVTYSLSVKGSEAVIVEGLNFIYSDNTVDSTPARTNYLAGGAGQINISEAAGVTLSLNASIGSGGWPTVDLTLPGVNFYWYSGDVAYELTALTDDDTYVLYGVNNGTNKIEFKLNRTTPGAMTNATWARPQTEGSISFGATPGSVSWTAPSYNTNYTTPSGIVLGTACCVAGNNNTLTLKVAAVRIDVDASTYYGRKNSAWTAPVYAVAGPKINWVSASTGSTGTVTVYEPTGKNLEVTFTFQSNDDAVIAQKAHVKFDGQTTSATYYTAGTDQDSDWGSHIGCYTNDTYNYSATDVFEQSGLVPDDAVRMTFPTKDISIGVGSLQDTPITLDTDPATTTPVNSTIGNTTVTLTSGSGSSVTVNKITPGLTKLDSEITTTTLAKPVVLIGGPAINGLVKNLVDGGLVSFTDLSAQGSGHAQVDFVENAFNSQTALVIAGYTGADTLMAAKAVAGALLNGQPFSFGDYEVSTMLLNTGTTAVSEVSVMS